MKKTLTLFAFLLLDLVYGQVPNISYASPQTYSVGKAITPLNPSNTGGVVVGSTLVSTLAGSTAYGSTDGTGTAASFNYPTGIAVDGAGNVYVSDYNHKIRKINTTGVVTTLAGNGTQGVANGIGTAASFNYPTSVAVDAADNVFVADYYNHKIRKINAAGVVTTLAGSNTAGATDGTSTDASFNHPQGVAVDAAGNVYVADTNNHKIRKINSEGAVTTLAGNGTEGAADGTGTAASFNYPSSVAVDAAGNVYVADTWNHKIRKITDAGVVTTLAGIGTIGTSLSLPRGVAVDAAGNVFVGGDWIYKIRKITSAGLVSILAGSNTPGAADGTSTTASFSHPQGVAVDAAGNVYVADTNNHNIRKITQVGGYHIYPTLPIGLSFDENTGVISGTPTVTSPMSTYTITASNSDGNSTTTISLAVVNLLPPNISYTSPQNYSIGTAISPLIPENTGGLVPESIYGKVTTLAGSTTSGATDGIGTDAFFRNPWGIAADGSGNVYVADQGNLKIRKITANGIVTTLAGNGTQGATNGTGISTSFNYPSGVAVDAAGNVYVADRENSKIRKISAAGIVTTLAGKGTPGATNGTGASASFSLPSGVAVDGSGNVYVADNENCKIRKITATGVVTNLAGNGYNGITDGAGTTASFNNPEGVAVDATGNVYVADTGNHKIRKITPAGAVTTLAGNGSSGTNDGTGTSGRFNNPMGIAVDATGNVYVADSGNHKIRKITLAGAVTTLAGSGAPDGNDGYGTAASFSNPRGIAVDISGNIYIGDFENHKIRKITYYGYSIYPKLPAGLDFDATTGIISGTPTVASPLTTYTVTATNSAGSTTTTLAISTAVLGTASFTKEPLTLFPNPAHNLIQIQSSDNLTIDRVIITDLTGKVILEQALDTNTINIAQLASGMYIIKAFSGQQAFTSKFMKAL